jgi:hypothetical protein
VDEMNNFQGGTLEMANSTICQSCGSVTKVYEETTIAEKKGIIYAVFGWLFFAISILFLPILFGAGALYMGYRTFTERSQAHGVILMLFAAVGLVLGSLISIVVAGTMFI